MKLYFSAFVGKRQGSDPQLDADCLVESDRHVMADDVYGSRRHTTLRHEGGPGTLGQFCDEAGRADIFG
ncbi:hypothetical protein SAMN05216315_10776 [Nitrosospira sp. Nsp18]|uniref:hypothetical protein n=1 Tax=Nitrosospira sp. Nsp18 TaxID=1855334 RepID=UPI000883EA9B|nr:hypothetical protein [Nitrosospira sp. Nsp18]SDA16287.1 hypothetical protein SAMN05216315_10776 [Nitrosospira sp. Nsp18]